MKYVPDGVRIVKGNLFEPPIIFRLIQEASGADDREMYQVFNMGCRMEIYTDEKNADRMIRTSEALGIDAQIIGRVEHGEGKSLTISTSRDSFHYDFTEQSPG